MIRQSFLRLFLVCGVVLLASINSVSAQENQSNAQSQQEMRPWSTPGLYVFIGGVLAMDQAFADELESALGVSTETKDSVGLKLKLGSRPFKHFAVEVELEYLVDFTTEVAGVDITYLLPTREVVDLDYVSLGFGLQYKF